MNASPTATNKKDLRYYSLDFWRGVACLMVAVLHSAQYITDNPAHIHGNAISKKIYSGISQGWAGVPLFFVISGYCIAAACEAAMNKGMPLKTYFFRRFKRIYPPYWILLLAVVGLHLGFQFFGSPIVLADNVAPIPRPAALSVWQWLGTITLTEGWREHLIGDPSRLFMTHAWSLCYEEQFYFVCGVAMLFGRKWFYQFLAVVSAAVFAIAFINYAVTPLPVGGFFFDGRWMMFAAGVLVFYVVQSGGERSRKLALGLLALGIAITALWLYKQSTTIPKQLICSFPFAMLLIVLFKRDRQIAESRLLRPITLCGVMCYSLYLVHVPVEKITSQWFYHVGVQGEWATLFLTIPVSMLVAVLVAWGFHLLVERRFLNSPPAKIAGPKAQSEEQPALVGVQS